MEQAVDISTWRLALLYGLLIIPVVIILYLRLPMLRDLLLAVLRMTLQLAGVGLLLLWLFRLDNNLLNIAWVLIMVVFAAGSAVRNSNLPFWTFIWPVLAALLLSTALLMGVFNGFLLNLSNIFSAQYLIVISGMLLGNALKGIIIGLSNFYDQLHKQEERYLFRLAAGASLQEALLPFYKDAINSAFRPSIATMATMGIVFLPGMMTGQIIGGSLPDTAIKYQIAIMLAVFVVIALSLVLALVFSLRQGFDGFGRLKF